MREIPEYLRKRQALLQGLNPLTVEAQAIPYSGTHWSSQFPNDADVRWIVERFPEALSRGQILQVAQLADSRADEDSARRFFLAVMMWGYGDAGFGPWRTAQALSASGASHQLRQAFDLVCVGHVRLAYERFHLPRCGPAFFTKFFYFAGLTRESVTRPLILDTEVANAWRHLLGLDFRTIVKGPETVAGVSSIDRDAGGYMRYLEMMSGWGAGLGCRPDSIELLLFREMKARKSARSAGSYPGER